MKIALFLHQNVPFPTKDANSLLEKTLNSKLVINHFTITGAFEFKAILKENKKFSLENVKFPDTFTYAFLNIKA